MGEETATGAWAGTVVIEALGDCCALGLSIWKAHEASPLGDVGPENSWPWAAAALAVKSVRKDMVPGA